MSPRGFLYGPLCPIYGVGLLLMILFLLLSGTIWWFLILWR
ncbi:MAG: putative ABC transporter permease [Intestinimonas sp.]